MERKYNATKAQVKATFNLPTMREAIIKLWGNPGRGGANIYRSFRSLLTLYNLAKPEAWQNVNARGGRPSGKKIEYAVRDFRQTPAGEVDQAKRDASIPPYFGCWPITN